MDMDIGCGESPLAFVGAAATAAAQLFRAKALGVRTRAASDEKLCESAQANVR